MSLPSLRLKANADRRLRAGLEAVQRGGGYIDFVTVDPQVAGAQATVGVGFEAQARQGHDVAPEKRAGVYRVATVAGLVVDMRRGSFARLATMGHADNALISSRLNAGMSSG
jgi:hypothetical protein